MTDQWTFADAWVLQSVRAGRGQWHRIFFEADAIKGELPSREVFTMAINTLCSAGWVTNAEIPTATPPSMALHPPHEVDLEGEVDWLQQRLNQLSSPRRDTVWWEITDEQWRAATTEYLTSSKRASKGDASQRVVAPEKPPAPVVPMLSEPSGNFTLRDLDLD